MNKKWGNTSKDLGLGCLLGGLCNILFPKRYNKKYMYQRFLPHSGMLNKSIIHIVVMTICMNVAKEPIFIYCWNIYFCTFSPIYFLTMFHTWHKILATNWTNFAVRCSWDVIISMMSFYSSTVLKTHLKVMVPGLRGPAGGPCKSEDITGWGLICPHWIRTVEFVIIPPCFV